MATSDWLQKYYGKEFDLFNPEIVKEGKVWAIVKLTRLGMKNFSGVGFVLIKKKGNHQASPYKSLHEGLPTKEDMERMMLLLQEEESAASL